MIKTIRVTEKDIKAGIKHITDGKYCPIAQAIRREFPGKDFYVFSWGVSWYGTNRSTPSFLPSKAQEFILKLPDVSPIEFELDIPE